MSVSHIAFIILACMSRRTTTTSLQVYFGNINITENNRFMSRQGSLITRLLKFCFMPAFFLLFTFNISPLKILLTEFCKDIEIIGISPDDVDSHKKFCVKMGIKYVLLADTEKEVSKVVPNTV